MEPVRSNHSSADSKREPSPEIVAEVRVSTATAIVVSKTDPYRVLVADSAKHKFPVLPGGKLEAEDISGKSNPGLSCVMREVEEEINTTLNNPTYIGTAFDPDRDIRIVPASKVTAAVVEPSLPAGISADAKVKAHFGCPDYIFVGEVDEASIRPTDELKKPRFIDIRQLGPGDLSAGHDVIVLAYRQMLQRGQSQLPEDALKNFAIEREAFLGS